MLFLWFFFLFGVDGLEFDGVLSGKFQNARLQPQSSRIGPSLATTAASHTHPSDVPQRFSSDLMNRPRFPTRRNDKRESHRRSKMRCTVAMMLAESLHPSDVQPRVLSTLRKLDEKCKSRLKSERRSVPAMKKNVKILWHSTPAIKERSVLRPDATVASSGLVHHNPVIESKIPEALTERERNEAMEKFHTDWDEGNPRHPSYKPKRLDDIVILAKDGHDGSLIGFAYGKRYNADVWYLDRFIVSTDRQGKGLGTELVLGFLEYVVKVKHAKAFFSSTQVHRVASLRAQRKAYDKFLGKPFYPSYINNLVMRPRGIGYYHFDPDSLRDPPSALVLYPLAIGTTPRDVSEWKQMIRKKFPSAEKNPIDFREFLHNQGFVQKFGSSDALSVLAGILEEAGFAEPGHSAKTVLPLVDNMHWSI